MCDRRKYTGLKIMPAVVEMHPAQLPLGTRRKYTREDCLVLEAAGRLDLERYELIDGELIRKVPKSRLHSIVLKMLLRWLRGEFGEPAVEQEVPIDLSRSLDATNEPEPDAIVLRRTTGKFPSVNPGPADLLLVAEVAVSTRDYDLGAKAALYAKAGIVDYWVLDLVAMQIVVHRNPVGERYESIVAYFADEPVAPLAAEGAFVCLRDLVSTD